MINSILRGFGFGLGKAAANNVVKSSRLTFGQFIGYLFLGAIIGIVLLGGLAYWASTTDISKEAHAQYELKNKK